MRLISITTAVLSVVVATSVACAHMRAVSRRQRPNAASVAVDNIESDVVAKTPFSNFTVLSDLFPGDWLVVQGGFNALEIGLEDAEAEPEVENETEQ